MGTGSFSVVISATDRATGTINKINKSMSALPASMQRLQGALGRLADTTGITAMGRGLVAAKDAATSFGRALLSAVGPLGVITSAASVAGVVGMARAWGTFGQRLGFDARRIGTTAERLNELQGAAKLAGSSSEAMTAGLRGLQSTLTDTAMGQNPQALVYFRMLGVTFQKANGQARGAAEVLPEVADALRRIEDPELRARVGAALLGGAYEDLRPLLDRGSRGIADLTRKVRELAPVTEESQRRAEAAAEAQARLSLSFDGLGNSISERVAPVLGPLMDQMTKWVSGPQPGKMMDEFQAAIGEVKWDEIGGHIKSLAGWTNDAVQSTIGWTRAIEALAAAVTLSALTPLIRLGAALTTLSLIKPSAWLLNLLGVANTAAGAGVLLQHGDTAKGIPSWDDPSAPDWARQITHGALVDSDETWRAMNRGGGVEGLAGSRPRMIYDRLIARGLTPEQAAGMVANFEAESSFNPGDIGDGGQAYGLAQWHPERQARFLAWAGHDIRDSSWEEQTDFAVHELRTHEATAWRRLQGARSAREAGSIISQSYEVPRDPNGLVAARRGYRAEEYYRQFNAGGAASPAGAPAVGGGPVIGISPMSYGLNGAVQVEVFIRGAPPGTTATARSQGAAVVAPPRIERAMPGAEPRGDR